MANNDYINKSEPTNILALRILFQSGYFTLIEKRHKKRLKQMEAETEPPAKLKLNSQVRLQSARMGKMIECAENIHTFLRTVPRKSQRLKEAEKLFYDGEFVAMDKMLDPKKIHAEAAEVRKAGEKDAAAQLQALSYELVMKALFHYIFIETEEWRKSVLQFLTEAVELSENLHTTYELADYLSTTDETDRAFALLDTVYSLAEPMKEEVRLLYQAKCLQCKAFIQNEKKEFAKAGKYASKAAGLYTKLFKLNANEYRPNLIEMLTTGGDYNMSAESPSVAIVMYEEAAKLRRPIVPSDLNALSLIELVEILDKQGSAHFAAGEHKAAFAIYEEALQFGSKDDDKKNNRLFQAKGDLLTHMADAYMEIKDYEAALRCAKEAMEMYEKPEAHDPFGSIVYLILTRSKLHDIYTELHQKNEAIEEKEQELTLRLRLATAFGPDNEPSLSNAVEVMHELTTLYLNAGYYDALKKLHVHLAELLDTLVVRYPNKEDYRMRLGFVFGETAFYYKNISPNKGKMVQFARRSYKILSHVKLVPGVDSMYKSMKKILAEQGEIRG